MEQKRPEIYISTDIESDGPVPPINSMLSFGSAALTIDKELIGTFSANLETLPGAVENENTMRFWARNPEAWAACRHDPQDPETVMGAYSDWLGSFGMKTIFVGYPLPFDFHFIRYYLHRFTGNCPFGFSGIDIKTYRYASAGNPSFARTTKKGMRQFRDPDLPHTHVALDDAIEQGALWINLLRDRLELPRIDRIIDRTGGG